MHSSFEISQDHLTDSEAVCFRNVFVFVKVCKHTFLKVVIVDYWGRRIDTHTLLLSMLRDLCVRWSLGGVFFLEQGTPAWLMCRRNPRLTTR